MAFAVPNRPFGSEIYTGLELPGGFFEAALGTQTINTHFVSDAAEAGVEVYVESVSDPNIVVSPTTHQIPNLAIGALRLLTWRADFASATPGVHRISFVVRTAAGRQRIIKKIFVTRVGYDETTGIFRAEYPEGRIEVQFTEVLGPHGDPCYGGRDRPPPVFGPLPLGRLGDALLVGYSEGNRIPCPLISLISRLQVTIVPTVPYSGATSDLPFQDPNLKEVLMIIALILFIIAVIAAVIVGAAVVITASAGTGGGAAVAIALVASCCASPVAVIGMIATGGALLSSFVASLADFPDLFRRLQEATPPGANERTVREVVAMRFEYPDPVSPGTSFRVRVLGDYRRDTVDPAGAPNAYARPFDETNANTHVLSRYEVEHPNVVRAYRQEHFVIKARFFDRNNNLMHGDQLYVQCFLEGVGPLAGQFRRFLLQDDGVAPDMEPNDGVYSGKYTFTRAEVGDWHVMVLAQDVNQAQEGMSPENAARHLGSVVLTNQITVTTTGGSCPLVPDGDVRVL